MQIDGEKVGEEIAAATTAAIEAASENAEIAAETAEQIAAAALEGARGERVRNLEGDMDECLRNQSELSMAVTGMADQLATQAGQLSTLLALLPSLTPPSAADGQKDNPEGQEPEPAQEPEAPEPEPPPPESRPEKPRRVRRFL